MNREEAIDFLECRRAYYASLSTDPNPYVKETKVCGYTLAESANACLIAIKALEQDSVLDKIRAEIEQNANRLKDSLYGDGLRHALEIIDKYKEESEVEK